MSRSPTFDEQVLHNTLLSLADNRGLRFIFQCKVVPADNSCLFTAINYCMSGEVVGSENSAFMREVIASVVGSDQEKYSEAILGRENKV